MLPREFHARRRACRAIFLAGALAPALAVLAWGLWRQTAWHVGAHAAALERATNLAVELAAVKHPAPGVTVYQGLTLRDPETRAVLARVARLEAVDRRSHLVFVAQGVGVEAPAWPQLAARIENSLQQREIGALPLRLVARDVALAGDETCAAQRLEEIHAAVERRASGPRLVVDFRLAGLAMPNPARLQVARNRQLTPPRTEVELRTQGAALPVPLAARLWPALASLGHAATFRGNAFSLSGPAGSRLDVCGRLAGLDLNGLVGAPYGHILTGSGLVDLHEFVAIDGRVVEAHGAVYSGPGIIGRPLLAAVQRELAMRPVGLPEAAGDNRPLRYKSLAAQFDLGDGELLIQGLCDEPAVGIVVSFGGGAALASAPQSQAPSALPRALLANRDAWSSVGRTIDEFARRLPLNEAPRAPELNVRRPTTGPR